MASRKREETEKALRYCHHRCVICGWNSKNLQRVSLVAGAHVKPVVELEKDSYDDIIALCPNHHVEFDSFLFYIDPKSLRVIHTEKASQYNGKAIDIPYVRKEYLGYRQYMWEQAQEKYTALL